MQTIVNTVRQSSLNAQVCAVIANKPDAAGLAWAQSQGITVQAVPHRNYGSREAFDDALRQAIDVFEPDYVLLAGFMRVLTPGFVEHYNGRLINIHPSLLPAFPGLHTHQQALAMGVQWHGCTLHFVTPVLDHGPIIAQGVVPVMAADTPDDLAQRLLQVEHTMYAEVVRWLAQGRVSLDAMQRVTVRGVGSRSFVLGDQGVVSPECVE
jgi:phosphoribosylglycinamide formyltransferase-1